MTEAMAEFLRLSRELWPYVGGVWDKRRADEWRKYRDVVEQEQGFTYDDQSAFQKFAMSGEAWVR